MTREIGYVVETGYDLHRRVTTLLAVQATLQTKSKGSCIRGKGILYGDRTMIVIICTHKRMLNMLYYNVVRCKRIRFSSA